MSASNPVAIPVVLVPSVYALNSQTTMYAVPAGTTTIIDKFTATNNDSGAHTLSVNLVPSGSSAGATNLIIDAISVGASTCLDITELQNQILAAGDIISVVASSSSNIVIRASGRQCS